jgi:hypothetical protein
MHKLVILIEKFVDMQTYEQLWPEFLHQSEAMPGLLREATSRVEVFLYGNVRFDQVHELYFDTLTDAQRAMSSAQGQAAGKLLQQITAGRMILFIAETKEDDLEHILQYHAP